MFVLSFVPRLNVGTMLLTALQATYCCIIKLTLFGNPELRDRLHQPGGAEIWPIPMGIAPRQWLG